MNLLITQISEQIKDIKDPKDPKILVILEDLNFKEIKNKKK
jgi:hypothetical protein